MTGKLPEDDGSAWLRDPLTQNLLDLLNRDNAVTRCVGGCVRDTLLSRAQAETEVDMATTLAPQNVMARLAKADIKTVPTGLKHGTVTAILPRGESHALFEITTLRRDVETDGRHAKVQYTDDWAQDAARRDFTINALYADADGQIYDPNGQGLADIAARRVRFIGAAAQRISEDHLRVLRFFRFHFTLAADKPMDAKAYAACCAAAEALKALSGERKQAELLKMLALPDPSDCLTLLAATPFALPVFGVETGFRHDRLAALTGLAQPSDALLRLAALLDSTQAPVVCAALKLSKKQSQRVLAATAEHSRLIEGDIVGALYFDGAEQIADAAMLALAEGGDAAHWQGVLAQAAAWQKPDFPLNGAMMRAAGLTDGPEMGEMARALEQWWVAAGFPETDAVKAELARRMADQG